MKQALRAAFPLTIPVMLGYLFAGMAFGVLFQQAGYSCWWAGLMSLTVYAGSMQYIAVTFFTGLSGLGGLVHVALMTLLVNIRHLFYGISFLRAFRKTGHAKWYLIFSLTDETYSLLCGSEVPKGVEQGKFFLSIALLDQLYWIVGSMAGGAVGTLLTFDTTGIDFALTALFLVIFTEQWLSAQRHIPALVGLGASVAALLLFGPDSMIIPAMAIICILLMALRRTMERGQTT